MLVEPDDGQTMRMLRQEARLSQAELAERVSLTEHQIADIETGILHPASDLLSRAAEFAGYDYIRVLSRKARSTEEEVLADRLRRLVSQLIARTTPSKSIPRDALTTPWLQLTVGLLCISRELLRSIFTLEMVGHAFHAAPALARSVFENVTVAFWVAELPDQRDERFLRVVGAGNRSIRLLAAEDPAWAEKLETHRSIWRAAGLEDGAFDKRLDGIDQLLTDDTREFYAVYRYLSSTIHPSWWMAGRAFDEADGGTIAAVEVPLNLGQYAFAACMVWRLAFYLECVWSDENRTGLGFSGNRDEFVALGVALAEFTKTPGQSAERAATRKDPSS